MPKAQNYKLSNWNPLLSQYETMDKWKHKKYKKRKQVVYGLLFYFSFSYSLMYFEPTDQCRLRVILVSVCVLRWTPQLFSAWFFIKFFCFYFLRMLTKKEKKEKKNYLVQENIRSAWRDLAKNVSPFRSLGRRWRACKGYPT